MSFMRGGTKRERPKPGFYEAMPTTLIFVTESRRGSKTDMHFANIHLKKEVLISNPKDKKFSDFISFKFSYHATQWNYIKYNITTVI